MVLGKIKQILGIDSSTAENEAVGTRVTVEQEGDEVASVEASVESTPGDQDSEASAAAESDTDEQDSVVETESEPESSDSTEPTVEEIKGIGPAYADRLADIGIDTVSDLAKADPAEIDTETSIGEGRATTWIGRAQDRDD